MTSALLFERNQKSAGAQELVSVVMTSAYLLDEAGISNADVSISVEKIRGIRSLLKLLSTDTVLRVTVDKAMLAGFTTEEAEADTVADQGLKRVNRIFGGLNEGIWPKTEELTIIYEVCWKKCRRKKMNSRCLESVAQDLVSAMMTSAYLLEKAVSSKDELRAATMTSALLFERNQKSAGAQELVSVVMTSAYLLEEAGISNADVSISVEKIRGIRSLLKLLSTDTVRRVTVDKAVGRYYYRSCWQTSPFKREGICD
ncbi:hypothetical protein F511_39429 [Dorcoceras hygrometricum]|uniref:Uncharacterized protein n=1 Tax=Dorcoceras hygrometricum TaxID=472368 RepID=A0A2Z7AZF1_9LAMI|nr:hypothetical protein F511_39429 [Dorcoceras hygrometricum]